MLGSAAAHGFEPTSDAEKADVLIVNTCGFIEQAREESIDAILTARRRDDQWLVVAGCLSQRHRAELEQALPEVDAFLGLDDVANTGPLLAALMAEGRVPPVLRGRPRYVPDHDAPRIRLTPPHTAYVKIAEGCNHPCSFCTIPRMRGAHRSRPIADIVREVRDLVAAGVREINLISQDTTYYGMDLGARRAGHGRGPTLEGLLDALAAIDGDFWIRLLYTHPAHWSDPLIAAIARNPRVARYIDMPLQHIHPAMLKAMRRETSRPHIENLITRLRDGIPGLAIRTTFIVGFPGESDAHFDALLNFIRSARFERLGVFPYSREEGTRAASMDGHLPARTKNARLRKAMTLQQGIAADIAAAQTGRTLRVLADTPRTGRTEHDAPDVDCRVLFSADVTPGEFVTARVTGSRVYDLLADPVTSFRSRAPL